MLEQENIAGERGASARQNTKRSIFRDEAVRRYVASREQSVLPPVLWPKTFLYLWALLGLLAAGSVITWLAIQPTLLA
jgi:hypothetical protein